ncbi:MAG: anti-sigma factor antagonist [Gammaproteobacteria bacterium]|nr:MAG: anti-sigma factor antagonist [Gammaproteobacteria bacterium]
MPNVQMVFDQKSNRYHLNGILSLETVPLIKNRILDVVKSTGEQQLVEFELSRVTRMDSVGLSLMVEITRTAKRSGKELKFYNIQDQVCAIARVSSLEVVLPIYRDAV